MEQMLPMAASCFATSFVPADRYRSNWGALRQCCWDCRRGRDLDSLWDRVTGQRSDRENSTTWRKCSRPPAKALDWLGWLECFGWLDHRPDRMPMKSLTEASSQDRVDSGEEGDQDGSNQPVQLVLDSHCSESEHCAQSENGRELGPLPPR